MATIKRDQLVVMNQHYRRFSLDYFLDCQVKAGFQNIELWCGASHFWIDSKGHEDCGPLKKKLRERGLKVVSVCTPSCAYQYQYASQEKEILKESFNYFSNGIRVAAELGQTGLWSTPAGVTRMRTWTTCGNAVRTICML